ncbi:hypothetical protein JCGZ_15440 [Jatropha curcas]|uniref:Uncharacterized protein n=1 Tax=Jatropha curcas TaxID=180498 RepID=A0A067KGV8_JATCU|nr:hypothetical protein JCGZ_15440 [Jatropha curcas]
MCAMLNIWDDCSSDEEEKVPVKIEIEKSIMVQRGLGYSEKRKKERYEIRSPVRGPNLNQIFFVPQAEEKFQNRGKTYPGLEIFMTDYEEKLVKSPEPSWERLVDGTEFMVKLAEEKIEATPEEQEEGAGADEVIQAIKDTCNECIEQAANPKLPRRKKKKVQMPMK